MKDVEIEIKVKVESTKTLVKFLENNASFLYENHQVDEYFTPVHRNFLDTRPVNEWLRLRNSGGRHSINYKNWHYLKNGKAYHCDEYESGIEGIDQVKTIFKILNYKKIVVVDKIRKVYMLKDWEIALDKVVGLGDFVEIEYKGKIKNINPKKLTQEMIGFLKMNKCGKIERNYQGYPFLLLFPNESYFEDN